MKLTTVLSVLAGAVAVGVMATVSMHHSRHSYYYVFDKSKSAFDLQQKALGAGIAEMEQLPPDTIVTVAVMDSETHEIYSGPLGDTGLQTIIAAVRSEFAKPSRKRGTDLGGMFAWVCSKTQRDKNVHHVRIFTDGGDDYAKVRSNQVAYARAVKEFAGDVQLADVVIHGVRPGLREPLLARMIGLSSKLRILTPDQLIGD